MPRVDQPTLHQSPSGRVTQGQAIEEPKLKNTTVGSYRQHRAPGLSHAERAANRAILRKIADGLSEADAIASLSPDEKRVAKSQQAKAERMSKLIKTDLLR